MVSGRIANPKPLLPVSRFDSCTFRRALPGRIPGKWQRHGTTCAAGTVPVNQYRTGRAIGGPSSRNSPMRETGSSRVSSAVELPHRKR